jgi:hypothetical protein
VLNRQEILTELVVRKESLEYAVRQWPHYRPASPKMPARKRAKAKCASDVQRFNPWTFINHELPYSPNPGRLFLLRSAAMYCERQSEPLSNIAAETTNLFVRRRYKYYMRDWSHAFQRHGTLMRMIDAYHPD